MDEYDTVIFKAKQQKMEVAFANALKIIDTKQGRKEAKKGFGVWLDDELKTFMGFDKDD